MNFKHFIALNVADALTTWYSLTYVYRIGEANPIYSYAYAKMGLIPGLLLIKLILLGVIWGVFSLPRLNEKIIDKYNITYKKVGIHTICILLLLVVINNTLLIL